MMRYFQALSTNVCRYSCWSAGAVSLKKPHHIITLQFIEVVNDHPNYALKRRVQFFLHQTLCRYQHSSWSWWASVIRTLLAPFNFKFRQNAMHEFPPAMDFRIFSIRKINRLVFLCSRPWRLLKNSVICSDVSNVPDLGFSGFRWARAFVYRALGWPGFFV